MDFKLKHAAFFLLALALFACKDNAKKEEKDTVEALKPISNGDLENAIIYEANIRQYSPEGTFNAFTKDIPELKKLGVKVIWLMPVFPISHKNRKAKGDLLVEDILDVQERTKYLGSYYAVADYNKVNPDLGTEADLKNLIKTAHENGMYVILDWVANHTGWDNLWITSNPEFYTRNEKGEMVHPEGTDWTDTADLDYSNKGLRKAMTASMEYWVREFDIDGYRCDVADKVPTDFWVNTVGALKQIKPVFMLAESESRALFEEAFDMGYNWEGHHLMNGLAQGKTSVQEWDNYMKKVDSTYQDDDILMNFITNHDENSWNGTVKERMGDAGEAMLVMSYAIPGMPLIYSGQEYGMDKRLKFFEKDTIPKQKGHIWNIMERLALVKNKNPALHGGKNAAAYNRLKTTNDAAVYAFERINEGRRVVYMVNTTKELVEFQIPTVSGKLIELTRGGEVTTKEGTSFKFPPYGYRLFEVVK